MNDFKMGLFQLLLVLFPSLKTQWERYLMKTQLILIKICAIFSLFTNYGPKMAKITSIEISQCFEDRIYH